MDPESWSIFASALGFLGTVSLFVPGWRVSRTMKIVSDLRKCAARPGNTEIEGHAGSRAKGADMDGKEVATRIVGILEQRASEWRPMEHWMLFGGISLIALSFAVDLLLVKFA